MQMHVSARRLAQPSGIRVETSPLRYPGGKTRAVKILLDYIPPPEVAPTICSPFFGGGSLELALAKQGRKVHGYDSYKPLVNFWQHALKNAPALADYVRDKYWRLKKDRFYALQKEVPSMPNNIERAAAYFALNRSSFSGCTLSGGMSPGHPRFTESAIDRLANFRVRGLSVKMGDFTRSIPRHEDAFLYLDPPYYLPQRLYGEGDDHIGFDHEGLAELLRKRERWILSYNDCKHIRALYKEYRIIEPKWIYGMCNGDKRSREILVLSRDIPRRKNRAIKVGTIDIEQIHGR